MPSYLQGAQHNPCSEPSPYWGFKVERASEPRERGVCVCVVLFYRPVFLGVCVCAERVQMCDSCGLFSGADDSFGA